jgi:hypothetical protein
MPTIGPLGSSDLVIVASAVFAVFWLSTALSVGLWVARDARARGSDQPVVWALASVFTPFGLAYYLYRRYRRAGIGRRSSPPTTHERVLATWASASLASFLGSSVLAPPDPFTQILVAIALLGPLLPLTYVLVFRGAYRTVLDRVGA